MSKKTQNSQQIKGQKSLFSFFQKGVAASTPTADNKIKTKDPPAAKSVDNALDTPVTAAEELEDSPLTTKKAKTTQEDDEEWMSSASEENSVDDDEDMELVDSESDSDDGLVGKRKKLQKKSNSSKKARTSSLPPLGKKKLGKQIGLLTPHPSTSKSFDTPTTNTGSMANDKKKSSKTFLLNDSKLNSARNTPSSITEVFNEGGTPKIPSNNLPLGVTGAGSHEHNFFEFLKPENRRDAEGNKMGSENFDPKTLKLPPNFIKDQTPGMAQWWKFKAENMDTILFFKVGKFYELYHMDADVVVSELELIYMKGAKAHSGFPEVSYGKFAGILVSKGYRVARIEQTETPDMLKQRNDNMAKGVKKEKVVMREVCSVMSKGTRTYCHLDDINSLEDAAGGLSPSLLVSIKEVSPEPPHDNTADMEVDVEGVNQNGEGYGVASAADYETSTPEYGICCVDTMLGTITLAQFQDDKQRSRLRTMLARFTPSEVLLERGEGKVSAKTHGVLQLIAPNAPLTYLRAPEEMPLAEDTVKILQEGCYYEGGEDAWPPVMKAVMEGSADGSSAALLTAIGGVVWQLRRSLIDHEILSMKKVFAYVPPDDLNIQETSTSTEGRPTEGGSFNRLLNKKAISESVSAQDTIPMVQDGVDEDSPKTMTLDEIALTNLEVLVNNHDRSERGSLWSFVNHCKTAFGKRLLREWLCNPLFRVGDINRRADAVEELLGERSEEASKVRGMLKGLPDLARLLARVHSNGLKKKSHDASEHPDCRAILFESSTHNARKIRDFADILTGFETVLRVVTVFNESATPVTSELLKLCVKSPRETPDSRGKFPREEMNELLKFFRDVFDEKQAKKDGNIKPRPGVNPDYDEAHADLNQATLNLENHLKEMKRSTGINDLKFFGSNKDRYQIEVLKANSSKVPEEWSTKSQKKTHLRYWTPEVEHSLLPQLVKAEERLASAQNDTLRKIFERFDSSREVWSQAVSCIALLDALLSLTSVSSLPEYVRPQIVSRTEQGAMLRVKDGRHPMLESALMLRGDGEFIPNDLTLGGLLTTESLDQSNAEYLPKLLLLSGPNMGGKSTLLRQTCLIVILGQLGCRVPASECVFTPVDRIFTRVGASDRILAGQSTFFVELAETAMILHKATQDSLCILDELGRGTATFDGTAIAHAVVDHLTRRSRCRSLFATHYHSLVDEWEIDPRVRLGHMDCFVTGGDQETGTGTQQQQSEEVTFLYKLCDGSSPRSYGINVARLAGLPDEVIELALKQSREFEEQLNSRKKLSSMSELGCLSTDQVQGLFERLVSIADTDCSVAELASAAKEMWSRCKMLMKLTV